MGTKFIDIEFIFLEQTKQSITRQAVSLLCGWTVWNIHKDGDAYDWTVSRDCVCISDTVQNFYIIF